MNYNGSERTAGARRAARLVAGSIIPSLLAVVAVAALVTGLYVWHEEGAGSTEAVEVRGSKTRSSIEPTMSASQQAAASTAARAPSPSPTATSSPSVTSSASSDAPEPSTALAERRSLVVLNQTRRSRLATRVAARLTSAGWRVAQVGNFRGNVSATTVYYPRGERRQAIAVAKELPGATRTRPVFGNLSRTHLTIVIADDYPRRT